MNKKTTTYSLLCLIILFVSSLSLYAQPKGKISGRIISKDGSPLELVTVSLKKTNIGVYTEGNGTFSIKALPGNYTLQVRYLGNKSLEIPVTVVPKENTWLDDIVYDVSENELDEVVVDGRNKLAQKNSVYVARMPLSYIENPQVYTVISKELLSAQVVTSMEDALKNMTGGSNVARGFGSGGVGVQVMQRGFSTSINMRNGMSTNSLALTDPINIERIEVIKGPSGALFGTTVSYGGLVNKVTKRPLDSKIMKFSYTAGSWSNNRFTADINSPLSKDGKLLMRVNALYATSGSYMEAVPINKSWGLTPSLTYKVNDKLSLNLDLEIYRNEGLAQFVQLQTKDEINLYNSGISSTRDLKYDWKRSYADRELGSSTQTFNSYFEARYNISKGWSSQTVYSHSGVDLTSKYFFINYNTASTFTRSINKIPATFDRDQFQQNISGDFNIGQVNNKLLVGIDYLYTRGENIRNSVVYDATPIAYDQANVIMNIDKVNDLFAENSKIGGVYGRNATSVYSAYVSDVVKVADRLNLLAALRVDHYKSTGTSGYEQTSLSPKFGIVYEVLKEQLSVFGNMLDGFKNKGSGTGPDGETVQWKPEHATQFEGGIKTQLFNNKLTSTIGFYNIKVKNIVRAIDADTNIQDGDRKSKGFDIDVTALPLPGWTFIVGYGYNDSKLSSVDNAGDASLNGNRPSNLPLHSFNLWTDYKLSKGALSGAGVGVGANYADKSYYSDRNLIYNPSRFTMDATVYYVQSKYRLSLKMNNLTNKRGWTLGRGMQPIKSRELLGSVSFSL